MEMNRRRFLKGCGGAAAAAIMPGWSWGEQLPEDVKITRIIGFDLESRRCKVCGKNSRVGVHGDRGREAMVRMYTNAGIEGLGGCRAGAAELQSLIGKNPFAYFHAEEREFRSPLGAATMPLWDLAGKVLKKPVFALLGGQGPKRVPVYDGSVYFADLLPEHAGHWEDRFKEEIDLGFKRGHRAFKIKVGRGAKWMPTEEGFERDLAVVKLIRKHAGRGTLLAADANDGYDLARAKRFLGEMREVELAFVEEMFREEVGQDLDLKAFIREEGMKTLVADGESQRTVEAFRPFMEAGAIDIYEGDINTFGIEGVMKEAAWARAKGQQVSPHGWGSLAGFYASLHVGRAITNYYSAENDPLDSDLLIADGYAIQDGTASVPEAPGFGLKLDEAKFNARIKAKFNLEG